MLSLEIIKAVKLGDERAMAQAITAFMDYDGGNDSENEEFSVTMMYLRKWSWMLGEMVEDLQSLAFEELWHSINDYDLQRKTPFGAYLFIRLNNLFLNELRLRNTNKRKGILISFYDYNDDFSTEEKEKNEDAEGSRKAYLSSVDNFSGEDGNFRYNNLKRRLLSIADKRVYKDPALRVLILHLLGGMEEIKVLSEVMVISETNVWGLIKKLRKILNYNW